MGSLKKIFFLFICAFVFSCINDKEFLVEETIAGLQKLEGKERVNVYFDNKRNQNKGWEYTSIDPYYDFSSKIIGKGGINVINAELSQTELKNFKLNERTVQKYKIDYIVTSDFSGVQIIPTSSPAEQKNVKLIKVENESESVVKTVYFGTNRGRIKRTDGKILFNTDFVNELTFGSCKVNIPSYSFREKGEINTPIKIFGYEFYRNPKRHVYVDGNLEILDKSEFIKEISRDSNSALVFIHGFSVTFEDAALRTAQMSYDLKFNGTPLFFSWPSLGNTMGYPKDSTTIQNSLKSLTEFLINIYSIQKYQNVYIISHSMGTRAISEIVRSEKDKIPFFNSKTKAIVLAAPDIDSYYFRNYIAPEFEKLRSINTIYSNVTDKALQLSEQFNGSVSRVGSADPMDNLFTNIETIDAKGINDGFFDHSYYSREKMVFDLTDLFLGRRAKIRIILDKGPDEKYWILQ